MAELKDIRSKFPQYNDLDDESFVNAFHKKFYSDMPLEDLQSKIGYVGKNTQGWKGVARDISKIPGAVGEAIYPGIPNQMRGIASNPSRIPGNILQGVAELGQAPTAAFPALADYLASKGIISQEMAQKTPLRPPNIKNTFNQGEEPGDILTQLLSGGINVPGGAKAVGQAGIKATQAASKTKKALEKAAVKATDALSPTNFISSPLSKEELIANFRAAQGTQTPLGNIIDSPLLKGIFENVTSEVPFSGADKITGSIAKDVKSRANELLAKSEAGLVPGDRRTQFKEAIEGAYNKQNQIKRELYRPADEIAKADKFKVELPTFSSEAKKYNSLFKNSPLMQQDKDFSRTFNQFKNYEKPYLEKSLNTIGPDGLLAPPDIKYPTIASAKSFASRLDKEAANYRKSPDPSHRNIASRYEGLAKAIRDDLKLGIETKGSPELKQALESADKNYSENFSQFLDRDVYKYTQDLDNIDNIINEIIKPGKATDKYSRLEKIQKVLPDEQKNILGNEWLRRAIDKEGDLDPKHFARLIDSLGKKQFEALFPDANYRQQLLDYGRLRGMNEKALSRMANPATGQKAIKPSIIGGQIGGAVGLAATGNPLMAIASLLGAPLGSKAVNKYLTSPEVRKKLIDKLLEKAES